MKYLKLIPYFILLLFTLNATSQFIKEKKVFKNNFIDKQLKIAKANQSSDYILDNKALIIKNKIIAIKVAEPILFSIYGE